MKDGSAGKTLIIVAEYPVAEQQGVITVGDVKESSFPRMKSSRFGTGLGIGLLSSETSS